MKRENLKSTQKKKVTRKKDRQKRAPMTMSREDLLKIPSNHRPADVLYPNASSLDYPNGNKYDKIIAANVHFINKLFQIDPPLDPNLVKALMASESGFRENPPGNSAIGIAQITKETLKVLQDPAGEAKDLTFKNISPEDLLNPEISIPLLIRWLVRKRDTAKSKLGREPTEEELILEYKGLLKSSTAYKKNALKNFRKNHDRLKK